MAVAGDVSFRNAVRLHNQVQISVLDMAVERNVSLKDAVKLREEELQCVWPMEE